MHSDSFLFLRFGLKIKTDRWCRNSSIHHAPITVLLVAVTIMSASSLGLNATEPIAKPACTPNIHMMVIMHVSEKIAMQMERISIIIPINGE